MATKPNTHRILRAFSLSLELFDHVKVVQRQRQRDTDKRTGTIAREGDPTWVTNSDAMCGIVYIHRLLTGAAERAGLTVDALVTALVLNGVSLNDETGVVEVQAKAAPPDGDRERSKFLPIDAAEHLAVFQEECSHASQLDALIEIIRTHATICEITRREGSPLTVIAGNAKIANEWHREGVRVDATIERPSDMCAH